MLKRRNAFRVTAAYLGVAWLIVHVATVTASLGGEYERALDFLDQAIGTGRGHREWILNDNDLAPLHEYPRFKSIIARLA